MVDQISNFLKPFNEIIGVIGLLLGVIGVVAAAVFYYKAKYEQRPRFGIFSQVLLSGATSVLEGLQVSFQGKNQDRVAVSRVVFWNDGRKPIRRSDLSEDDPLRIVFSQKNAEVLSCRIYARTSDANNVQLKLQGVEKEGGGYIAIIGFEFLNFRDGFVVDIVHNGVARHPIYLDGTVIGANPPQQFLLDETGYKARGNFRWFTLCVVALTFISHIVLFNPTSTRENDHWVLFLMVAIIFASMFLEDYFFRWLTPSVPQKLRESLTSGFRALYLRRKDD